MDESALVEDRCGADRGMDFEAFGGFLRSKSTHSASSGTD